MKLLQPIRLGRRLLANRVFMAPLVRARSDENRAPTDIVATYYTQRASAGLIITEGCHISPYSATRGKASAQHNDLQSRAWKRVVDNVHAAGGVMFQQIYHVGRKALISSMPNGALPVAPSALASAGGVPTDTGFEPFPIPRVLETHEIGPIVEEFRTAAILAEQSGFDGVEIHGAAGFLLDQFLRDGTNQRTDIYGGSIENRARFLLEVVDAVGNVLGPDRVGVRLSPHFRADLIGDSDPVATYTYVTRELNRRRIGYIHLLEAREYDPEPFTPLFKQLQRPLGGSTGTGPQEGTAFLAPILKPLFDGVFILNGGYTRESANLVIEQGLADAVSFGRLFISNPDLPERFRLGAALTEPDQSTYYSGGPKGYIDYPTLDAGSFAEADERPSVVQVN
jgi:N-ethylmaleimide reductase